MAKIAYSDEFLIGVLNDYAGCEYDKTATAKKRNEARSTFRAYLAKAQARFPGYAMPTDKLTVAVDVNTEDVQFELRALKAEIASARKDSLTDEYIKRKIFGLSEELVSPPNWLVDVKDAASAPGVPTLFASDWHWAEFVDPSQIGGVNEFNMEIAHRRVRNMITTTIDLLKNHMVNPSYPGIVFPLGGDMITGNIHEELIATNDMDIMPAVLDLFGVLAWCVEVLADEFGQVFCPCVTGNHGRLTHKIRAKNRNFTSLDWLVYCFLAKRFENDDRIRFLIPNGPDAIFRIYNHTYLLTHGDQFRGGDGMIGALGPIIRGDHKKRGKQAQIHNPYDTMIIGHWHQLYQLGRLIVNGSLKGYDEYAYANNFGFEPPQQALWMTHPRHGITFSMPVKVDPSPKSDVPPSWVSWPR